MIGLKGRDWVFIFIILITALAAVCFMLAGCTQIDERLILEWQKEEAHLMAELSAYIKSDPQKNAPMVDVAVQGSEQAAIERHLTLAQSLPNSVPIQEEAAFMAKLDEYNRADPHRTGVRKEIRSSVYRDHMEKFTRIKNASD